MWRALALDIGSHAERKYPTWFYFLVWMHWKLHLCHNNFIRNDWFCGKCIANVKHYSGYLVFHAHREQLNASSSRDARKEKSSISRYANGRESKIACEEKSREKYTNEANMKYWKRILFGKRKSNHFNFWRVHENSFECFNRKML